MVVWIVFISLIVVPIAMPYYMPELGVEGLTVSAYFATQAMSFYFFIIYICTLILSCKAVASDAADRTINYEFLAGHNRNRIFCGRILTAFWWGVVIMWLFSLYPVLVYDLIYGWGRETDKWGILFRMIMTIFPMIRICAFNVLLASLLRSAGKGIAVSYAMLMAGALVASVLQEIYNTDIILEFGLTNMLWLISPGNHRNVVIDGKSITLFDTALSTDMTVKTIIISLILAMVYILLARAEFKRRDRD
jgi:ABC-type transport system involved in multi-copper enzyme maturation permease subunit